MVVRDGEGPVVKTKLVPCSPTFVYGSIDSLHAISG